jgi:hypothetical protein
LRFSGHDDGVLLASVSHEQGNPRENLRLTPRSLPFDTWNL